MYEVFFWILIILWAFQLLFKYYIRELKSNIIEYYLWQNGRYNKYVKKRLKVARNLASEGPK